MVEPSQTLQVNTAGTGAGGNDTASGGPAHRRSSGNLPQTAPSAQKFKFCYIIRGLPGSGKSTVAQQLAGSTGVVLNLDGHVQRHSQNADNSSGVAAQEADSLVQI